MGKGTNQFKKAIGENKPLVGLWNSFTGNDAAQIVSGAGYDWVTIDMEHSPNDLTSVLATLQVYAASSSQVLVRPPWNDFVTVKKLADMGAQSFLFPMIQTVEEAQAAVASTRYPPEGIRGVAGATRASNYGRDKEFFKNANDNMCVIIQLETQSAMEKAEEIASVDGVDGVFFGPSDISADMGLLGQPMAQEAWEKINATADKVRALGKPVGTLVTTAQDGARLLNDGFSFVSVGLDTILLARATDGLLADVKAGLSK